MRHLLRGLALALLLLPACAGYVAWGYGWCDPYYDPYCYDYYYYKWEPASLGAGDFDGDGLLDLAVADGSAGGLWLVKGASGGGFEDPPTNPPGIASSSRVVGALHADGDGLLDLLVLDGTPGFLRVLLGDGLGGFAPLPPPLSAAQVPSVMCFAHGRLDADAIDDLVTLDENGTVRVALGGGGGTFTDAGQGDPARDFLGTEVALRITGIHLALAEFDGTPGTDLLVMDGPSETFALLSGHGDGTFGPAVPVTFRSRGEVLDVVPVVVRPGGSPQLAVLTCDVEQAAQPSTLVVLRVADGTEDGAPIQAASARSMLPQDLNGDGLTDLLLADQAGRTIRTLHMRSE